MFGNGYAPSLPKRIRVASARSVGLEDLRIEFTESGEGVASEPEIAPRTRLRDRWSAICLIARNVAALGALIFLLARLNGRIGFFRNAQPLETLSPGPCLT